jgi:hypothetical protein
MPTRHGDNFSKNRQDSATLQLAADVPRVHEPAGKSLGQFAALAAPRMPRGAAKITRAAARMREIDDVYCASCFSQHFAEGSSNSKWGWIAENVFFGKDASKRFGD